MLLWRRHQENERLAVGLGDIHAKFIKPGVENNAKVHEIETHNLK